MKIKITNGDSIWEFEGTYEEYLQICPPVHVPYFQTPDGPFWTWPYNDGSRNIGGITITWTPSTDESAPSTSTMTLDSTPSHVYGTMASFALDPAPLPRRMTREEIDQSIADAMAREAVGLS